MKREDLLHTGAHKINNCLGQALLARRMGKKRIIAETGAGQHGVATATVCALFGLECIVYMGEEDMRRQRLNVFRMRLLGAKVVAVTDRQPDAQGRHQRSHARLGHQRRFHVLPARLGAGRASLSADGARFPSRDRRLETRAEILKREGRLPDAIFACVGGGSNAIGMFHAFVGDEGVQADRRRSRRAQRQAGRARGAFFGRHLPACCTARYSYLLQDDDGQVALTHSVSAGLDYAIGRSGTRLAARSASRRIRFRQRCQDALAAARMLARTEGIIPALESAHAVAEVHQARARARKGNCSWSTFPDAATKTPIFIARICRSWTQRSK